MPHHAVRTGVDDAVVFLVGDRVGPKSTEVNPRPPGEAKAKHHHEREDVNRGVAELIKRRDAQQMLDRRREEDRAQQQPDAECGA